MNPFVSKGGGGTIVSVQPAPGPGGVPGAVAYTTTSASFVQPAVGGTVVASVVSTLWMAVGQYVFAPVGGTYLVTAKGSATSVTLQNTGATGNASPGATIASGSAVVASGAPGADGTGTTLPSIDTSTALTAGIGTLACLAADGIAAPTNNLDPHACRVSGVLQASGELTRGRQSIRFTTAGGKPVANQRAFAAAATDDNGTGSGAATATEPPPGVPLLDYYAFAGGAPQNPVEVCTVIDATNYDASKTCIVDVLPGAGVRPALRPDETYCGGQYQFTASDYFTAPSNTTNCGWKDGESWAFEFAIDETYDGSAPYVAACLDATFTGWTLAKRTYMTLSLWKNGVEICFCPIDYAKADVNIVVGTIRGTTMYAAMVSTDASNMRPRIRYASAAITDTITQPGAGGTFFLGGAGIPYPQDAWPHKLIAVAKLGALSQAELGIIAGAVVPSPPTDRFHLHPLVTKNPSLQLIWHADRRASVVDVNGANLFTLTTTGAPLFSIRKERRRTLRASDFLDSIRPALDALGHLHASPFSAVQWTSKMTTMCVGYADDNPQDWDNDGHKVSVNGAVVTMVEYFGGAMPDGKDRWQWNDICSVFSAFDPTTSRTIGLLHGGATQTASAGVTGVEGVAVHAGFATNGGRLLDVVCGVDDVFATSQPGLANTVACNKRIVAIGEDLIVSHDAWFGTSLAEALRADYPASGGPGRVSIEAASTRFLYDMYLAGGGNNGDGSFRAASMDLFALRCIQRGDEGAPGTVVLPIHLGWIDYVHARCTPTLYGQMYGALLAAIHARRASWLPVALRDIHESFDAIAFGGYTRAQFVAAQASAVAALPWMPAVQIVTGPTAILDSDWIDPMNKVHLTSVGNGKVKANLKTKLLALGAQYY